MIYPFQCQSCDHPFTLERPMAEAPECIQECPECFEEAHRVWVSPHVVAIGCSARSDPDKVPERFRVTQDALNGTSPKQAEKLERAYAEHIQTLRDNKRPGSSIKESVPAELYWGKIKETGDKKYWDDPKNRKRHKSVRI